MYTRREFLHHAARLAAVAAIGMPVTGAARPAPDGRLSLYHTHTRETLRLEVEGGGIDPESLVRLNRFLRDFRTGDIHPIDPGLVAQLLRITQLSRSSGTFQVISGYRSEATNKLLRATRTGVAKKSLHMLGQAIDIRLTDLNTRKLRDIAWSMKAGGVGYYPSSKFVHLDTGPVRRW